MAPFADSSLGEGNSLFKAIVDNIHDGLYTTDLDRRITYWNRAAEVLTGYSSEEVVGKFCADNILVHVEESGCLLCTGKCPLSLTIADGEPRRSDLYFRHKLGHRVAAEVRVSPIMDKNGKVVGAVELFHDNSRQLAVRESEAELRKWAYLDAVSQVANRRYLDQKLAEKLDQYSTCGTPFGILLCDVDQFKCINDTHGHVTGDAALVTVAKTLSECLRASDLLGRWGGDEFMAILGGTTADQLAATSERCKALVAQSAVSVDGVQFQVTISVGAAMVLPGDSAESLLTRADRCMYNRRQACRKCETPEKY